LEEQEVFISRMLFPMCNQQFQGTESRCGQKRSVRM